MKENSDFFRVANPLDRKDALIIYGGSEIARLEKSLPDPEDPRKELDEYQKLRKKLNEYILPKKNKHYARYIPSTKRNAMSLFAILGVKKY